MILSNIARRVMFILLASSLTCIATQCQNLSAGISSANPSLIPVSSPPSITLLPQPKLVGTYLPDGRFRSVASSGKISSVDEVGYGKQDSLKQIAVPRSRNLHPYEQTVENFTPPARASHPLKGQTLFGAVLDNIVTFAYGHEKILVAPTHIVTDSQRRTIVTDPKRASVHVLDISGKNSFRIEGGPRRRLRSPNGVAVDADDNIYVADTTLGLVVVFDSRGRFLRYLGKVQGESILDSPTGIAIDAKRGRLYVLDAAADELIAMDIQGRVLQRIGGRRGRGDFHLRHPTEISVWHDEIIVLDNFGSRITILDADCRVLRMFNIRNEDSPPVEAEVGLALDSSSNIYISNLLSSTVRIYGRDGQFRGFLGGQGNGPHRFDGPIGLWVDSVDQLFVADTQNGRIMVFQISKQ